MPDRTAAASRRSAAHAGAPVAGRHRLLVGVLAGWTLFVWGTRVRNIVRDGGSALSLTVAVVLVALAVLVAVSLFRDGRLRWALPALVVGTVVTWAVRAPLILIADHGAGFKVVHTALALVSVVLAVAAWRSARGAPAPR